MYIWWSLLTVKLWLLLLLLFTGIVCSIFLHFNFSLLQNCLIHCMPFFSLLDGVWLSRIKRFTYLLTYLHPLRRYKRRYKTSQLHQQWAYLTERTKSPLMVVLSRTRNTPLSLSAFKMLFISSRNIIPMNQLQSAAITILWYSSISLDCMWTYKKMERQHNILHGTITQLERRSVERKNPPPTLTFDLPKFNHLVPCGQRYDWRSLMTIGLELAPGSCS